MSEHETLKRLETRLETMSLENFPIETGLSPPITPLTSDSISAFLQSQNCRLESTTVYCLSCNEKLSCNLETHIFIAEHASPVGVYCRPCRYILIAEEQTGFKGHLLSSVHRTANNRTKRNRRRVKSETRQKSLRENKVKQDPSPKTLPVDDTKCNRQQTSRKPRLSYIIKGFSRGIEFNEFFYLCTKFGLIKSLAINYKRMEAHVTFYKFDKDLIKQNLLGNSATFQSVDQFRGRKEEKEWIQWHDSINLSPSSQNIMSSLKNIKEMVSNALTESAKLKDYYHSKIKVIKAQLIHLFEPAFSIKDLLFYGAAINGLTPRNEGLFTFLDCCPKNDDCTSTVDPVMYLKNHGSKMFDIHQNMEGYPLLVQKRMNIMCVLNIGDPVSYLNDCYVRLYRSVDTTVTWLMVAFREWWSMNMSAYYISSKNSPIEWLVIFFLMQPDVNLVPSFKQLLELYNINITTDIKGKDLYEFGKHLRNQHGQQHKGSNELLLIKLFLFYAKINFHSLVLSPVTGNIIHRFRFLKECSSDMKDSEATKAMLTDSPIVFLNPLEPSCNLLQQFDSESTEAFKNKLNMTVKCMM